MMHINFIKYNSKSIQAKIKNKEEDFKFKEAFNKKAMKSYKFKYTIRNFKKKVF